jgi:hypothetical protein
MNGLAEFAKFILLMTLSLTFVAGFSLARSIADFRARRRWWAVFGLLSALVAGAWAATYWKSYI